MKFGVPKETFPGERRVALVPEHVAALVKKGFSVSIEAGAGEEAGFTDAMYQEKGAVITVRREDVFSDSDVVLQVRCLGSNPQSGRADLSRTKPAQTVIGFCDPLSNPQSVLELSKTGVTAFSMELMPRITRAQSMDALSSMATAAGYKAVLLAAELLPRFFPMLTTAAGTIQPAKVFVIGAGVAGLQALASARRLGAVTSGYDVRPAVKEQVQSLGAKFIELPIESGAVEDKGGYAKALDEAFYKKQRELMKKIVSESDVVITTAAVPGKKSPVLITQDMVDGMRPGSVIVDLAAERGGNCELTQPDRTMTRNRVTIIGPTNLPAGVPYHASMMYGKNVLSFLNHLTKDGSLKLDVGDEITRETLLCRDGEVVHPRIRELLDLNSSVSANA